MPHISVDDLILKALKGGPVTVNDVTKCFENPVRMRLEKLRVRGVVIRENRGRNHREFIYKLLRPDLAARALAEKGGGLSRAAKVKREAPRSAKVTQELTHLAEVTQEPPRPAQSELLSALIAGGILKGGSNHSRSRRKEEES
jgi:hypothetical protein